MSPPDGDDASARQLLREQIKLFDERQRRGEAAVGAALTPPSEVYLTASELVITVELPGVEQAAVSVEAADGELTIRGRRAFVAEGLDFHRLERAFGEFHCQVRLPKGVDPQRRTVRLEDGVLTVEIPRT